MTDLNILACISRVVLTGDERAFERIVRTYQEPLRRFFVVQTGGDDYLADELTQETFIRIWQRLDSFRRLAAFTTWLYRVAYNVWLEHLRKTRQEYLNIACDDTPDEAETALQTDALSLMAQRERQEWVTRSLTQMQEPAKTVLTLFYLQDLSVREISDITALSVDNVRAILSHGRKKLKLILQQNNPYK